MPPPPIPAYAPGSFARLTIDQRLPWIIAGVTDQLDESGRLDPRWPALAEAISSGGAIDTRLLAPETSFWRARVGQLDGARWQDLSFFELEFVFYLAVRTIARDVSPGLDVFRAVRDAALAEALPQVARAVEAASPLELEAALLLALAGNEADLSQLARPEAGTSAKGMLLDERAGIVERVRAGGGAVQLLADNAGSELCFDLVLVDALLRAGTGRVEVQLKPQPMFVSDALVRDAEAAIDGFCRHPSGNALRRSGERLRVALQRGELQLRAPEEWAEPRHVDALGPELSSALRAAAVVLAKGDLHYRRVFEDRAWPPETPVPVASVADGMCAFALRVLKSDCVVGLDAGQAAQLSALDPGWRSSGRYSLVQRIDRGA